MSKTSRHERHLRQPSDETCDITGSQPAAGTPPSLPNYCQQRRRLGTIVSVKAAAVGIISAVAAYAAQTDRPLPNEEQQQRKTSLE